MLRVDRIPGRTRIKIGKLGGDRFQDQRAGFLQPGDGAGFRTIKRIEGDPQVVVKPSGKSL